MPRLEGESVSYTGAIEMIKLEHKLCTCFVRPCKFHGLYTDGTEVDPYGPDGVFGEHDGADTRPLVERGVPLQQLRCTNCRTRSVVGIEPVRCFRCGRKVGTLLIRMRRAVVVALRRALLYKWFAAAIEINGGSQDDLDGILELFAQQERNLAERERAWQHDREAPSRRTKHVCKACGSNNFNSYMGDKCWRCGERLIPRKNKR